MRNEINIKTWIENQKAGKYDAKDTATQCEAGWYDWFCKDTSLANKTKWLAGKVKKLAKSPKVDTEHWYVWFKNNCTCNGRLYDDFRFADIETGEVKYTIIPKYGYSSLAEVWGVDNDFKNPLVAGDWDDVLEFFGL